MNLFPLSRSRPTNASCAEWRRRWSGTPKTAVADCMPQTEQKTDTCCSLLLRRNGYLLLLT